MEVAVERVPTYISAAKIILSAAGPAQKLVKKPGLTHTMCNRQAHIILFKDGYNELAAIIDEFGLYLDKGVSWADEGFKNMAHFLNPRTLRGLHGWTDAARECSLYWNKAVRQWQQHNFEQLFSTWGRLFIWYRTCVFPIMRWGYYWTGIRIMRIGPKKTGEKSG